MSDSDSSDSESRCASTDYIFYRNRRDWKDVTPVPQDDGPYPVVAIQYSDKFKDASDYIRGVMKAGEKSLRALELTSVILEMNPGNYSIWQYRRDIIKHLGTDLNEELKYTETMIDTCPKNYQLWHHRQVLVSWTNDPSQEFKLTESVLKYDPKNYHAWEHRQWVTSTFSLWSKELEYVNHMLENDVRNNSAWNQRYFVVLNATGFTEEVIERELLYTTNKIKLVVSNESPWNYLRGVIVHTPSGNLCLHPFVRKFCEDLYNQGERSHVFLGTIIDMCGEQLEMGKGDDFFTVKFAVQLCSELASTHDKIRREYWLYLMRRLQNRAAEMQPENRQVQESTNCVDGGEL